MLKKIQGKVGKMDKKKNCIRELKSIKNNQMSMSLKTVTPENSTHWMASTAAWF